MLLLPVMFMTKCTARGSQRTPLDVSYKITMVIFFINFIWALRLLMKESSSLVGSAEHLQDLADPVKVVLAREHELAVYHLPQDAAHAQDVQCLAVHLEVHHEA